jgi:hypothetical protein
VKPLRVATVVAPEGRMRRATTTLALALCLLGCSSAQSDGSAAPSGKPVSPATSGEPVELLTGVSAECWAGAGPTVEGPLLSDPKAGTTIKQELSRGQPSDGSIVPVMWPTGYTGRRVGLEVEVLDPAGNVVAVTGRRYLLEAGPVRGPDYQLINSVGAFPACFNVIPK